MPRRSRAALARPTTPTICTTETPGPLRACERATTVGAAQGDRWRTLLVPREILVTTWHALAATARRGVEGTVRWAGPAGVVGDVIQVVTTVVVPDQIGLEGSFVVPHEAVRRMGAALRSNGLVNLAQLHTHPGAWVGHSAWDDAEAYSRRNGALSIVWPFYGALLPSLEMCGVHECQDGCWVQLHGEQRARRMQLVDSVLDLRTPNHASPAERSDPAERDVRASSRPEDERFAGIATRGHAEDADAPAARLPRPTRARNEIHD